MTFNYYIEGGSLPTFEEVMEILELNGYTIKPYEASHAFKDFDKIHNDSMSYMVIKVDNKLTDEQ